MMPRKLLFSVALLLILLFSLSSLSMAQITGEVKSEREEISDFIKAVRNGDRRAFRIINYELLEKVIEKINADRRDKTFFAHLVGVEDPFADTPQRRRLISSTLSGMFNADPRVRLVAINFLRRLRPDASMARDVKRALAIETVASPREKWRLKNVDEPYVQDPTLEARLWGERQVSIPDAEGKGVVWIDQSQQEINNTYETRRKRRNAEGRFEYVGTGSQRTYATERVRTADGGFVQDKERKYGDLSQDTRNNETGTGRGNQALGGNDFLDVDLANPQAARARTGKRTDDQATANRLDRDAEVVDDGGYENTATKRTQTHNHTVPKGEGQGYWYIDFAQVKHYDNVWAELNKLDMFITRIIWFKKVDRLERNTLVIVSKDTFFTLLRSIDGESWKKIPMLSLEWIGEKHLNVLIPGLLKNRVLSIKWAIFRKLSDIYKNPNTKPESRIRIRKALKQARYESWVRDFSVGWGYNWELLGQPTEAPKTEQRGCDFMNTERDRPDPVDPFDFRTIDVGNWNWKNHNSFVTPLLAGNTTYFKNVTYEVLEASLLPVIRYANNRRNAEGKTHFFLELVKQDAETLRDQCRNFNDKRGSVTQALLGGLNNADPRVRLFSIHMLRRMNPEGEDWAVLEPEVERIIQLDIETVDIGEVREFYRYLDIDGNYQTKIPREQLELLRRFVIRRKLRDTIVKGDRNALPSISKYQFETLYTRIDDEPIQLIPLLNYYWKTETYQFRWRDQSGEATNSDLFPRNVGDGRINYKGGYFNQAHLDTLITGLDNDNFYVQKGIAHFLINWFEHNVRALAPLKAVKEKIKRAIMDAEDDDVVVQEIELSEYGEDAEGREVIYWDSNFAEYYNPDGVRRFREIAPQPVRTRGDLTSGDSEQDNVIDFVNQ